MRSPDYNLSNWLRSLLSREGTSKSTPQPPRTRVRKAVVETLEDRRVFDAGWAATMDNTFTYAMDGDSLGNHYVTGSVVPNSTGVLTFEDKSVSQGPNNVFVAKQNANGQFDWIAFGGNSTNTGVNSRAIASDNHGNIFITGYFTGTATFGTQLLTSSGNSDGYVAKLNALTGEFLWARQFGGAGKDIGRGVAVDPLGNVVVTAGLEMQASAVNDAPVLYAAKWDTAGNLLWSQTVSGSSNMSGSFTSPAFDSAGQIYLGGRFQGTLNLPSGALTSSATIVGFPGFNLSDGFVAKLDANGNFLWGRSMSGNSTSFVGTVAVGPNDQLYASGTFSGTANYDGVQLVGAGGRDGFVARLNPTTGGVVWANQISGSGDDMLSSLAVDAQGNALAVGTFVTQSTFGNQTVIADGQTNAFLTKISPSGQFLTTKRIITDTKSPEQTANNRPSIKEIHIDSLGGITVLGTSYWGGSSLWTGVQAPQRPLVPRLSNMTYNFDFIVKLPQLAATKFYVVDDSNRDRTYQYGSNTELTVDNFSIKAENSSPRGAASNVSGSTVWVGDRNRNVYVYSSSGSPLGSWTASSLSSTAMVEGVATNGTDIWIVDNRTDRVFRHSGAASRTSGSQLAASSFPLHSTNSNPKGIVTDGSSIWVLNDSIIDKIFKYSISGAYLGSWSIDYSNFSPTGLTIDPTNGSQDIWVVDNGTDRIYQYANGRSRTSGSQAAVATYALAKGNTNPQGIADPPPQDDQLSPLDVQTQKSSDEWTNGNIAFPVSHNSVNEVLSGITNSRNQSRVEHLDRCVDTLMSDPELTTDFLDAQYVIDLAEINEGPAQIESLMKGLSTTKRQTLNSSKLSDLLQDN